MKLLFAPLAESDLEEIWDYLAITCANIQAAERQTRRIFACLDRLLSYPLIGRAREDLSSGLRYLPIDNYAIFYRVNERDNIFEVARILHTKRNVAAFFE